MTQLPGLGVAALVATASCGGLASSSTGTDDGGDTGAHDGRSSTKVDTSAHDAGSRGAGSNDAGSMHVGPSCPDVGSPTEGGSGLTTLASSLKYPSRIAVNGTRAYWTNQEYQVPAVPSLVYGSVMSATRTCKLAGCRTART